jgi:hypothetical protein
MTCLLDHQLQENSLGDSGPGRRGYEDGRTQLGVVGANGRSPFPFLRSARICSRTVAAGHSERNFRTAVGNQPSAVSLFDPSLDILESCGNFRIRSDRSMALRYAFGVLAAISFATAVGYAQQQPDEVMKSETVSVDYGAPNAVIVAFAANQFYRSPQGAVGLIGAASLRRNLTNSQSMGTGTVNREVFEWFPDRTLHNRDIWPEIEAKPGYQFADILTALQYALKFPDRQLQYPLVIMFVQDEQSDKHFVLCLDRIRGKRTADVFRVSLNLPWSRGRHFRFLLVKK